MTPSRRPHWSAMGGCLIAGSLLALTAQAQETLTPEAWRHADAAYKAYERRQYERALAEARAALALQPGAHQLQELVRTSQAALDQGAREARQKQERASSPQAWDGRIDQAVREGRPDEARRWLAQGLAEWPGAPLLVQRQRDFQRQDAQLAADRAYAEMAQGHAATAVDLMAPVVQSEGAPLRWSGLLVNGLVQLERFEAAEAAARSAAQRHPGSQALAVVLAALEARRGAWPEARARLAALPPADPAEDRTPAALVAADLALAAGDPGAARQALAPLPAGQPAAQVRQVLADWQAEAPAQDWRRWPPILPTLVCAEAGAAAQGCQLGYPYDPEFVLADQAYRSLDQGQPQRSLEQVDALLRMSPTKGRYHQLRVNALLALGRGDEARGQAQQALERADLQGIPPAEKAYLALTAGDMVAQGTFFDEAERLGLLPPAATQDSGYAAERLGQTEAAARRFRRVIELADEGRLALEPQKRQDLRVSVGALERTWGASVGVYSRTSNGLLGQPAGLTSGDSVQLGTELYWRPQEWRGYGTHADLYVRTASNLWSGQGDRAGFPTTQAALGARVKPLATENLVLALERLTKLGEATRNDWLWRVGYSAAHGTQVPAEADRWETRDLYAEVGRFAGSGERYATFEGRYGWSFRMDSSSTPLTLWPHGVLALDHNNTYQRSTATSAGLGVNARWWLREDAFHAGRSWFDLSLQYRVRLAGDRRNNGFVLRLSWVY